MPPRRQQPTSSKLLTRGPWDGPMAEGELERTLVLIKPDGVERGLVGEILGRFERKGLKLLAFNLRQVPTDLAERHYAEHAGKPFYSGLVGRITARTACAMALEGRSAISVVRLMIGATNPQAAAPGTIRGDLASALVPNLVSCFRFPDFGEARTGALLPGPRLPRVHTDQREVRLTSMAIAVSRALTALRADQVIVYQTDTLWGLGARADSPRAVDRVPQLKDRPAGQPLCRRVLLHSRDRALCPADDPNPWMDAEKCSPGR